MMMIVSTSLVVSTALARPRRQQKSDKKADAIEISVESASSGANVQPKDGGARTEVETGPIYPAADDSKEADFYWLPGKSKEGGVRVLTLDDCIKMAMERNRKLIADGYDIEAAEGQLAEAKAAFWPVFEYKYRLAPVPNDVEDAFNKFFEGEVTLFNSIHVGIGVPLTTFGQLQAARRMAEGGVNAARIRRISTEYDTVFQIKKIYYGIQLGRETIKLLDDAIGKMANKIEDEESKEEKDMDPYDILRLKVFKEELERRLSETRENLELAYEGLRVQLDLEPGTEIVLDSYQLRPLLHLLDEEKEFLEVAMENQPNSKLLDIGVEVKRKQYTLEKLKLLPSAGFGFFVDVGRSTGYVRGLQLTDDFNDPFNYTRAGLGLQLSGTIDFHGAYAKIKKARAEYYKATYERQIARRGLGLEMRKAYLDVKRMREEITRAKKAESLSHQMTFLSKINLDMGIGDEEKYADALKLLLLTRGQYFKTVFDFNMALAELERRIGAERYKDMITIPNMDEYEMFEFGEGDQGFEFYEDDATDMEGMEHDNEIGP